MALKNSFTYNTYKQSFDAIKIRFYKAKTKSRYKKQSSTKNMEKKKC